VLYLCHSSTGIQVEDRPALGKPPQLSPANQKLLCCTDGEQLVHLKNKNHCFRWDSRDGKDSKQKARGIKFNVTHSMLQIIRFLKITACLITHTWMINLLFFINISVPMSDCHPVDITVTGFSLWHLKIIVEILITIFMSRTCQNSMVRRTDRKYILCNLNHEIL
jgi:hypothetical protein